MLDKFDFGLVNSRLTYATWFSICRAAVFFVSKDYNFASSVNILAFNDCMNFSMKKYFMWFVYLIGILGLYWVSLNVGVIPHAKNITFTIIDYCCYCVLFAHNGRP